MRWLIWVLLAGLAVWIAPPAVAQQWRAAPEPIEGPALPDIPPDWTTVPGTFLRVHGPDTQTQVLLRLARHGSDALPELADALRVPIGSTIHVYLVDSDEAFRRL